MQRFFIAGLALCLSAIAKADRIEIKAADFASTRFLDASQQALVRQKGYLRGDGEADYRFSTVAGWYELWVEAADWPTDLYLDGKWLIHTPFTSGVWSPRGNLKKVMNLELAAGSHMLRFSRMAHPGLPWMHRFVLDPSQDITGKVRATPLKDYLCFRRGEAFPLHLAVGRLAASETLMLSIHDHATGQLAYEVKVHDSGDLLLPTEREGIFEMRIADGEGRPADRDIQFLVVDTAHSPPAPLSLEKVLAQTVDCVRQPPDYSHGETRTEVSPAGAYRESGDRGNVEYRLQADWFAYTLKLPSIDHPYLVEMDYPDDEERNFTYAIVEADMPNGRALAQGVASGGADSLSKKLQTAQMVFYPSQCDPRLVFRTWRTGQRAAVAAIRVYQIVGGFPMLIPPGEDGGREFGRYEEEPLQFAHWSGLGEGNSWLNLWQAAEHVGQYSRYVGVNLWQPTIAVYGEAIWPSKYLPSLDRDSIGWLSGSPPLDEPQSRDTIRLLLLASEKYRLKFVGELFMDGDDPVMRRYLAERVGEGGAEADRESWWAVPRNGSQPGSKLLNPLDPGVESWVADIVLEIAERYRDSPAFAGLAIRVMGWKFAGWQSFPSLEWGYGDSTIRQFEGDTGIRIPEDRAAPDRFEKRYEWLQANAYETWVTWRCRKIYAFHARLAKILTDVRSDLKLQLDLYGPTFGQGSADVSTLAYDERGWTKLLRESGIDPKLYARNVTPFLEESRGYPPGVAVIHPQDAVEDSARIDRFFDPIPIREISRPSNGGETFALHFDARSFESDMLRSDELRFPIFNGERNAPIHAAALVFPAGIYFLERYANSLADGNLVSFTDGSHGYVIEPPDRSRPFFAEYRRLPAIAMRAVPGSDDPVAAWSGRQNGVAYFYLVNRCDCPAAARLTFLSAAQVQRLATGTRMTSKSRAMRIALAPFELQAYLVLAGGSPVNCQAEIPPREYQKLGANLAFVHNLLAQPVGSGRSSALVPSDWRRAVANYAAAQGAWRAGRIWSVHRLLFSHELTKIYQDRAAWPPGLFFGQDLPAAHPP